MSSSTAIILLSALALMSCVIALWLGQQNRCLRQKLAEQRTRDPLTQIYNRPYFMEQAEREVNRAQRTGRKSAVLIIDIDGCKKLNEQYGHQGGDIALKQLAQQTRITVRDYDLAGRFSGEEIAILLPDTNAEGAQTVARRLREHLTDTPVLLEGHPPFVISVSIGLAVLGHETETLDDLLLAADAALNIAKKSGPGHTILH